MLKLTIFIIFFLNFMIQQVAASSSEPLSAISILEGLQENDLASKISRKIAPLIRVNEKMESLINSPEFSEMRAMKTISQEEKYRDMGERFALDSLSKSKEQGLTEPQRVASELHEILVLETFGLTPSLDQRLKMNDVLRELEKIHRLQIHAKMLDSFVQSPTTPADTKDTLMRARDALLFRGGKSKVVHFVY